MNVISNKRRVSEITAVVLTAIGKVVFMDYLNWRLAFVWLMIGTFILVLFYGFIYVKKQQRLKNNKNIHHPHFSPKVSNAGSPFSHHTNPLTFNLTSKKVNRNQLQTG
jgi:ABC-type nickel/cobalt efflux system permease component RcnA